MNSKKDPDPADDTSKQLSGLLSHLVAQVDAIADKLATP